MSDTALWVAIYRAQESERSDALFRDPLAKWLSGERGQKNAELLGHSAIMYWVMVIRTIAIDRLILKSIDLGVAFSDSISLEYSFSFSDSKNERDVVSEF